MKKNPTYQKQKQLNKRLKESSNKYEELKKIFIEYNNKYCLGIYYDFDRNDILYLEKINKKSFTCSDMIDDKIYLTEKIFNEFSINDIILHVSNL